MTTATVVDGPRPLRRDAERNRQRILAAAARAFAMHGLDAGVEEIARDAKVGMGTLYRRFPTKDALIAALVEDLLDTMLGLAKQAAEQPGGRGLEHFLEASSAYQAAHSGCLPRLWVADGEHRTLTQVRRLVARLLADAQQHQRVRSDLTPTDLTVLMWALRGVIETTHGIAPEAWRRHLDIVVAGLRPTAEPLAHRALSRRQVDNVVAAG
jgi:AcrR family transcriptional regulator